MPQFVRRALREAGLISVDGRIVRIANWPSLAAMADFDPIYLQADQQQDKAA